MKKVKIVIGHQFEWSKKLFAILVFCIVFCAVVFHFFKLNDLITFCLSMGLFISCIFYMSLNSLHPSVANVVSSHFSWKFFQGIPLNKKETVLTFALSSVLSGLPLIIFFFVLGPFMNRTYFDNDFNFFKIGLNTILILFMMGTTTVSNLIEFPRLEESRKNPFKKFIKSIRHGFGFFTCFLLAIFLSNLIDFNLTKYIDRLFDAIPNLTTSWFVTLFLIYFCNYCFQHTLNVWNDELASYERQKWSLKRELIHFTSYSLILVIMFSVTITPSAFKGDVQMAVYKNNLKYIQSINDPNRLNTPNNFGMTAMMAALYRKNFEMVKLLDQKGASYEGLLRYTENQKVDSTFLAIRSKDLNILKLVLAKKNNLHEYNSELKNYPVHLAVKTCEPKIIDFVINEKVDVNVKNDQGETPLMVAVNKNCFSAVISLKDAGADFSLKDKAGKTAMDYLAQLKKSEDNKVNQELQYFVEKNSRLPASVP